ncbi:related to serine/threonine-protein kinase ppk5 [Cephalotrichum gorgonifer]|uniref:non-specific serine/threonine protein kinase n=1 Tax=Cephalotrichum gorgonifer TaxID=2041049 RepID=A0AAE8N264_9PEZI|nr:related to serine/threonine-protein kinase ppk5 [Cephalotrichum gorgonifer]
MASPSSSDEGEIIESVVEDLKATRLPAPGRNGVDRQDRPRPRYRPSKSPDYDRPPGGYNRRSRSPRGYKRPRDDRDFRDQNGSRQGGDRGDPRRFNTRYEDGWGGSGHRGQRQSYNDLDRPSGSSNPYSGRYRDGDRDRFSDRDRSTPPEKRPRNYSRSPNRRGGRREDRNTREDWRSDRQGDSRRTVKYDDRLDRDTRADPVSKRAGREEASRSPRDDTKPDKGSEDEKQQRSQKTVSFTNETKQGGPEIAEPIEEPPPLDEDAEIERRRKRREAILARSSSATPLLIHALHAADKSHGASPGQSPQSNAAQSEGVVTPQSGKDAPMHRENSANPSDAASPASNEYSEDQLGAMGDDDLINIHGKADPNDEDGPSAADYDPTVDMKEDGLKDEKRHGNVGLHGELGGPPLGEVVTQNAAGTQSPPREEAAGDDDDDDFNMFADDFDVDNYAAKKAGKAGGQAEKDADAAGAPGGGLLEDADKDGYYKMRIGEILGGRYQVQATLGKGMFSGVVRAVDTTTKKLVAIKIMRNNDALRKGGFTEIAILQKINESDPEGRKHIVRFWHHFDHKGHLCMVFENLSLNLREVLKKFGNNVGINLNATRAYAHQIFIALAHLRKSGIVHADLKPDNILVNESRNMLKICDLGTAIDRQDAATAHNEITPYLVSRFYRAPEIMLGMPYDYSIDMWSIGCTLYELYTGKILFTGDSNNQMLKSIMEIRGRMPPKTYKKGELAAMHFDDMGNFISVERDKVLGKTTVKTLAIIKPTRDLRTRLMGASSGMDDAEAKDLNHFIDLLEQCLALNPEKRIKPTEALRHPFFTSRAGPVKR